MHPHHTKGKLYDRSEMKGEALINLLYKIETCRQRKTSKPRNRFIIKHTKTNNSIKKLAEMEE